MTRTQHQDPPLDLTAFVRTVADSGAALYRELPWRETRDPYAVLVSEVMLQQTQVSRVVPYYLRWLGDFPTLDALAAAPLEAVLRAWQGLGYNRRALALKRLAEQVTATTPHGAEPTLPSEEGELIALPGIGPATAAGVVAFAFGRHSAYLETNVRTVFLHELFADRDGVPDREIAPLVKAAAEEAQRQGLDARAWNYALLDYGAHLKRSMPNPSRRSAHHTRQSPFEGSRRQKRARLIRLVMEHPGQCADEYRSALGPDATSEDALELLEELAAEGFIVRTGSRWSVA